MGCGHEKECVGYGRYAAHSCPGDSRKAEELSRLCIPKLSHPPPAVNTSRKHQPGTPTTPPSTPPCTWVCHTARNGEHRAGHIDRPSGTTPHSPCTPAGRPRGGPVVWAAPLTRNPPLDAAVQRQRGERGGKIARKEPRRDGSQRRGTHLWAAAIAPPSAQASDGSQPARPRLLARRLAVAGGHHRGSEAGSVASNTTRSIAAAQAAGHLHRRLASAPGLATLAAATAGTVAVNLVR